MSDQALLNEGARNLLINCAELQAGDSVLIVAEDPRLGWYDAQAPAAVRDEARRLGMQVEQLDAGAPDNNRCPLLAEAMSAYDCTVFFSRKGDQDRFSNTQSGTKQVMSYARTAEALSSRFGRAPYQGFVALKEAINQVLLGSEAVHISCALGTDYRGRVADFVRQQKLDVSVRRFPVGVPLPISSVGFSGRIAMADYLTPTGSMIYSPPTLELPHVVFAEVKDSKIQAFTGDPKTVEHVRQHYQSVATQLQINRDFVHSWHAGIHPGCYYPDTAKSNPDLWSNSVFCNPRFLHVHTCGEHAPGEISIMVKDPTIEIDGRKLWNKGRLCPEVFSETAACLELWPDMQDCFLYPSDEVGLEFSA